MPLNQQEITRYHEDGLVIPSSYRIPENLLKDINKLYQKLLTDNQNNPEFSADLISAPNWLLLVPMASGGNQAGPRLPGYLKSWTW